MNYGAYIWQDHKYNDAYSTADRVKKKSKFEISYIECL